MRRAKPLAPARSTAARVTLKVTPSTTAAPRTLGQVVCSVVGLGGSSLSKMPQTASKSFFERKPARMPKTIPNGL